MGNMSRMNRWLLTFVMGAMLSAASAGCASDSSSAGPSGGSATKGSKKMPGEEFPAVVAFRAHAAKKLGIPVDQVQGGPISEVHANLFKNQRVGKIWAFVMYTPGTPKVETRGWATPDGKVITLEQNLGLLFAEAGVWGGGVSPPLTAQELADRLIWSQGVNFSPQRDLRLGIPAPELTVQDGAGTLTFISGYRAPGPGGAGGGPVQLTRFEIALTKDQQAIASSKPFTPTKP